MLLKIYVELNLTRKDGNCDALQLEGLRCRSVYMHIYKMIWWQAVT